VRQALLVFIVAGWLVAQTGSSSRVPADASANERLVQKQLSDLNGKMKLALWLGTAVGVLLLGAAWKSLERRESIVPAPVPAYAPYSAYAAPEFRQWEIETLVRRVVEELRRDADARQPARSTPA
jgi:hypothetical protein